MIKEIWGNGKDIIIKYQLENESFIRIAASKWLKNNSNLNSKYLSKCGYHLISLED